MCFYHIKDPKIIICTVPLIYRWDGTGSLSNSINFNRGEIAFWLEDCEQIIQDSCRAWCIFTLKLVGLLIWGYKE